jgi:hypothetical protein
VTRRNRKKRRNDGFMLHATPMVGILTLLVVLALGYVWLACRCQALGRDIQKLEQGHEDLMKRCRNEDAKWIQIRSRQNLQAALARHGIVMSWPSSAQIIRMKEAEVYGERWDALTRDIRQFAHLERSPGNE